MTLSIPVKGEKFMDVRLGQLPSWIMIQGFTPNAFMEHFKEVTTNITRSLSMWRNEELLGFPWCCQLMCFSMTVVVTGKSDMSSYASTTEEGPVWRHIQHSWPWALPDTLESFHILMQDKHPIKDDWLKKYTQVPGHSFTPVSPDSDSISHMGPYPQCLAHRSKYLLYESMRKALLLSHFTAWTGRGGIRTQICPVPDSEPPNQYRNFPS